MIYLFSLDININILLLQLYFVEIEIEHKSEHRAMEKIMPLELLASIKGATSSEAVDELFDVIRKAVPKERAASGTREVLATGGISLDELRSDEVVECPVNERELIRKNFPSEKNGYLVVPKVIED